MKSTLRFRILTGILCILCVLTIRTNFFAQAHNGFFSQLTATAEDLVMEPAHNSLEAAVDVLEKFSGAMGLEAESDKIAAQATANAQAASELTSETLASGSFIINMGANTQTKPAGLKPYGLIYELIKNHSVPVYWIINPTKSKDGVDFSYNGIAYRGGTFIVDKKYVTTAVASVISQWTSSTVVNGKGLVVGTYTTSPLTVTPAHRLTSAPKWTLDAASGGIAIPFFTNAGIPSSAYIAQTPAKLTSCDDIYVMPHADPKWATHGNLLNWNLTSKGAIWAACHAVSALENMYNPANTAQQTNFLATKRNTTGTPGDPVAGSTAYAQNSLMLWTNHNAGTPAYNTLTGTVPNGTLATPADPVAQFIGSPDAAMLNGSEQIYLPIASQGWRASTNVITYDPTQADVPANSAGTAVAIAYGRGLGDANRGLVMYEAGHSIDKGTTGDVPAQRAFFNFGFLATKDKAPLLNPVTGIPANGILYGTNTYNMSTAATFQVAPTGGTYTWSFTRSDNGMPYGSFSANGTASAATTTYTPPAGITSNVPGILTVKVNDGCGRETFQSYAVTLTPGPRPPVANPDNASIKTECNTPGQSIMVSVLANDTDPDGDALTVTTVSGSNGTWTTNGTTVTYTPSADFYAGIATATYTIQDASGLTASSTITVGLGTPDAQGCYPGSVYGVSATNAAISATASATGVTNPNNAVGTSAYDPADASTYAVVTTGNLVLNLGSVYTGSNRKLAVSYTSSSTNNVTMQVEGSSNGTSYSVVGTAVANNSNTLFETSFNLPAEGIQYIRVTRSAGTNDLRVDAAEIETYTCVPSTVKANDDVLRTNEDIATTIDVLQNDNNPGGLLLKVKIVQFPVNGRISLNPDNTFTYLGNRDYRGTDSFRYSVCNSQGICSEATVSVIIAADNCSAGSYAPLGYTTPTNVTFQNPNASDSNAEDAWLKRDSGGNDNYGNATTLEVGRIATKERRAIVRFNTFSLPAGAVVTKAVFSLYRLSGENATYTLNAHRMTETWTESTVTWLWRAGSTSPWSNTSGTSGGGGVYDQNVISSASSTPTVGFKDFDVTSLVQGWQSGTPNHGILVKRANPAVDDRIHAYASSENGTAAYRPKLAITYVMPQSCAVIPNRAPLANPDYATTNSSTPVSVPVLANDYDVDLPIQTLNIANAQVSITSGAGTAVVDPANNRNILFTPSAAFSGTAEIRYRITDGSLTDEAIAYVTVNRSAPVANRDNATILSGETATINIFANDLNPSNLTLAAPVIISNPKKGSASFSGNTLSYTPAPGFYGVDTLMYQICEVPNPNVCNQEILCSSAMVVVTVSNRAPVAVNDVAVTNPCQPVTIKVTGNDSDPEGGVLSVTIVQAPAKGSAVVSGSDIIFTPVSSFRSGSDTFTYRICDDANPALCATATVTVNMNSTAVNNAPVAVNDDASGVLNNSIYIDVLTNDSDPDNNQLIVSLSATGLKPKFGAVYVLPNGLIEYRPNANFVGFDYFDYTICDVIETQSGCSPAANSLCATARVTVEITDFNMVPLPVELVSFSAVAKDWKATLSWKTASETNNDRFEIERSSDGKDFKAIGTVKGQGSSSVSRTYTYTDTAPLIGTSYYRLKQVDFNGTFDYSSIKAINLDGKREKQLEAFPNPFKSTVTVNILMPQSETAHVKVINMQGREVYSLEVEMNQGHNQLTLPLERLATGMYILRVSGTTVDQSTRVMKVN